MNKREMTKEELLDMIETLEKNNALLKAELVREKKMHRTGRKRSILEDIDNREKAVELLAVGAKNGKLYRSTTELYQNFQTFYSNLFRALNPSVVINTKAGTEYIRYSAINDLDENDYKIHIQLLQQCIELIYESKQKLGKYEAIMPSTDNT